VYASTPRDLAEELGDLIAELLALRLQRLGGVLDVVGGKPPASASVFTPLMSFRRRFWCLGRQTACCA